MKIIRHSDIANLNINDLQCFKWAEHVIKNKHKMILPAKISLVPMEGVFYNTMPSIIIDDNIAGVKVVTRYPERVPSLDSQILLYDLKSGNIKAILDGNFITALRTGSVAAHSIILLAKEDFSTLGLIGLGNTMRATLKILFALFPKRNFNIKVLKYKEQHSDFYNRFSGYKNLTFSFFDDVEQVIKGSDVIISAVTLATKNFCTDDAFDEGCLVVPIHTRGFGNCDLFFDKVFADDTDHVKGFKYFNMFKSFAEISDIVNGKTAGRDDCKQRILAYNIGISVHDVYFAEQIFNLCAKSDGIEFNSPKEKFWI